MNIVSIVYSLEYCVVISWILCGKEGGIVTNQLLQLQVSWKSVKYLNLVNARPRESHVERISLRLYTWYC